MSPAAQFDPSVPLTPAAAGAASTNAVTSLKDRIETVLAMVFGAIFIVFAFVVSIETICRKVFNFSLQGADELGGYALAVGSTIAFSLALMGRCHIRVDVFHERFSRRGQALLNWLSIASLASFGLFIVYVAFKVLADTLEYGSTAQTPWATPLIWPQSVWYLGLVTFALVASGYAIRASRLLLGGQIDALLKDFSPKSAKEELKEELDDLSQRQATTGVSS
ncbi:TRAP-type mannitol/chloroaromatic compound transport system, small permease component [Polaromonas sp. OV174]|uniref:TRAP transporter small permease subunit n=1 Tax=Polaromonas sp. OV174 TaxID=1855300 RepID=UPI0008EA7AA7|nr:TRAP transporter small permease [Polaromonas sp. OV174]SFC58857.1 TRAP-type mannitol/chloroaromatic compound transport system, small permease component [Polaromonas sp. OV174]